MGKMVLKGPKLWEVWYLRALNYGNYGNDGIVFINRLP